MSVEGRGEKSDEDALARVVQTGWTGLVAPLLNIFGRIDAPITRETERRLYLPGSSRIRWAEQARAEIKSEFRDA